MIEDELATRMLKDEFGIGDSIKISAKDDQLTFDKVVEGEKVEETEEKPEEEKADETQE